MKTFTVTRQVRFGGGDEVTIHNYIIEADNGAQASRLADAMKTQDEKPHRTECFKKS